MIGPLLILALAIPLVWLPRGLQLDRLVTPDEPLWLARSANFAKGLANGDYAQTYQYAHPGVTTMWAGMIGYHWRASRYVEDGPERVRQSNNRIAGELRELGIDPLATLTAGRRVLVVFITLVLAATAWYAVRLFGIGVGLLGAAILGTDPFHVALSRLLHLDGLLSSLLILAAVAWLAYLRAGRRWQDLVVAGVAVGLAGLTRSMAIVLLPMILISAATEGVAVSPGTNRYRRLWPRLWPVLALGATAMVTFVVCWPAMWTDPIGTSERLVRGGLDLGARVHARPIFFDGRIYSGTDPGLLFYPVSFLWRATPTMLAGIALATAAGVVALVAAVRGSRRTGPGRTAAYLALLAISVLVLLILGEKKLDRYILPVTPPLALVAAWGYGVAAQWLASLAARQGRRLPPSAFAVAAALLVAGNAVAVIRSHPYGLSYYNPILGGASGARSVMMIGWGEGLDRVADTIAALPDAGDQRVITSAWQTPINYFAGETPIVAIDLNDENALTKWAPADFYLWYITADQRGYIPAPMQTYFAGLEPIKTVQLEGITYAALYDLRTAPLPPALTDHHPSTELATGLRLLTASLPVKPAMPGTEVTVVLYLTGLPPGEGPLSSQFALAGPSGEHIAVASRPMSAPAEPQTIWSVRRRIALPAETPDGVYRLLLRVGDGSAATQVELGTVTIQSEIPALVTATAEPADEPIEEE